MGNLEAQVVFARRFAAFLAVLEQHRKVSQAELARRIGQHPNLITNYKDPGYESGPPRAPMRRRLEEDCDGRKGFRWAPLVALALLTAPLAAQAPGTVLVAGGLGYGTTDCRVCGARRHGVVGSGLVAYQPAPVVAVGIEGTYWHDVQGVHQRAISVMGSVTAHTAGPLYVRVGAGWLGYRISPAGVTATGGGFAASAAFGADLPVAGGLAVTPFAGVRSTVGRVVFTQTPASGFGPGRARVTFLEAGVALTYRR